MATATLTSLDRIEEILGAEADSLLQHHSQTVAKEHLHLPGPDFVDRVWIGSDRSPRVLRSLQSLYAGGRLAGTGYLSILPVDQGVEHSGGASFAPNPECADTSLTKPVKATSPANGGRAVVCCYSRLRPALPLRA